MIRKMLVTILALCLLSASAVPALAVEAQSSATSGTCGEGITWTYENHVLTISGNGDMEDGCPWEGLKDKIEHVVFTGGVAKVGAKAFENFDRLETVDFGDAMREIGKRAFYDCNDISDIRLPETFRCFGEESFRNCQELRTVICEGGIMPSFRSACLNTGNYISVFYPPNNPWAYEYYQPVMSAYGGQLGFFMASEDIMESGLTPTEAEEEEEEEEDTEETEEVEQETAEATEAVAVIAEETVPETTEATVPETTAATVPETTAATEPETEPAETTIATEAPTEAPVETTELELFPEETEETVPAAVEKKGGGSWMALIMIAGVITFLIAGAMIFRGSRRGRY